MCYHDEPPYDDLPKAKPPTRIVVAGQTVDVVPWPALPEMAATAGADHELVACEPPCRHHPDEPHFVYAPRPSRLERIAAAFGWRW